MKPIFKLIFIITISNNVLGQVPDYVPTNGLVAYWPFNGNADDESGNGLDGTIYGSLNLTEDRNGNQNKAYSWPSSGGSGNYIFIPDFTNYLTDSYSISFWMLMDGGSINPRIMSKGEWTIGTDGTSNSSRTMTFGGGYVGGLLQQNVGPIEALEWVHVVWTADGTSLTGESKVYINGNLFSSSCCHNGNINPDWTSVNPSDFNIGRKSISAYDSWGGKLDDIGIWNRVLTQQEVSELYDGCQITVSSQASDQEVDEGDNATFNVTASPNSVSYQWQKNTSNGFENISDSMTYTGTTTNTLTISSTTMNNDNEEYRCVLSTNNCEVISNSAVLTVNENPNTSNCVDWQELISENQMPQSVNVSSYAFNKQAREVYFVHLEDNKFFVYDIDNNTINLLNLNNWPSSDRGGSFIYNPSSNKIMAWREGTDNVYEVTPQENATWSNSVSGSYTGEMYGSNEYYNSINNSAGEMNGYGYYEVKNWVFETSGGSWNEIISNQNIEPYKRLTGFLYPNQDYTKLYMIDGAGNMSGSQTSNNCNLSDGWASDVGTWCWLKDIWEFDLSTHQWNNVIPLDSDIIDYYSYANAYDYDKNNIYFIGGYIPADTYQGNIVTSSELRVLNLDDIDDGINTVCQTGDIPDIYNSDLNGTVSSGDSPIARGVTYYDQMNNNIMLVTGKGIWAFNSNTLNIQENSISTIKLYPNPATHQVTLSSDNNADLKYLIIYNMLGQKVKYLELSGSSIPIQIDVEDLASGNYFIKIITKDRIQTKRIIKR
jgi:hypothetical protein